MIVGQLSFASAIPSPSSSTNSYAPMSQLAPWGRAIPRWSTLIVAPSLSLVVFRAVYTDANAKMQAQAIAAGGPVMFLDAEEAALASQVVDQVHTRAWELWKRKAMGR